jgi:hypothetical protein
VASSHPEWPIVFEATRFAAWKHRDQRRPDAHNSPFINHLLDAMDLVIRFGGKTETPVLVAVALHDVLSHTRTTPAEIEQRFGSEIRKLVEEVSDVPGLSELERRHRRLTWAATASPRARVVRLATMTAALCAPPVHHTAAERREYLQWMSDMASVLGGTNCPLAALFAERVREAQNRAFISRPGTRVVPRPARNDHADRAVKIFMRLLRLNDQTGDLYDQLIDLLRAEDLELSDLVTAIGVSEPAQGKKPPRRPRFTAPELKEAGARGVESIHFAVQKGADTLVTIDAHEAVAIPAALGEVLLMLASGARQKDGYPAFQTFEAMARELTPAGGPPVKVHAVKQRLYRLLAWLKNAGQSPCLVETTSPRRARLRVRRPPAVERRR